VHLFKFVGVVFVTGCEAVVGMNDFLLESDILFRHLLRSQESRTAPSLASLVRFPIQEGFLPLE